MTDAYFINEYEEAAVKVSGAVQLAADLYRANGRGPYKALPSVLEFHGMAVEVASAHRFASEVADGARGDEQ